MFAYVLQHWVQPDIMDAASIAMPLYDGSLADLTKGITLSYQSSLDVCKHVAEGCAALWMMDLAYCDLKTSNILFKKLPRKKGMKYPTALVLADIGGIAPMGDERGMFTFPPQRAVWHGETDPEDAEDGFTLPEERDLVWSIGTLMITLLLGPGWAANRLTGQKLRDRACRTLEGPLTVVDMTPAFDEVCCEILEEADKIKRKGDAAAACALVMHTAVRAWCGESVTIEQLIDVIR